MMDPEEGIHLSVSTHGHIKIIMWLAGIIVFYELKISMVFLIYLSVRLDQIS